MLIVRQEQFETLRRDATRRFVKRLSDYLRESFPSLTPDQSFFQAHAALTTGRQFQILNEDDIADFAEAVCRHCAGFPLPPLPEPVMATLKAVEIPAAGRVRRFRGWFAGV